MDSLPRPARRAPSSGARARSAREVILVGVAACLLILPSVGRRVIDDAHQARFAVLARDMLERRVWFGGRVVDEVYRNKPPLYPWSIAALSRLTGRVSEATAQLPVALAAVGTVVVTFLLGRRLFGARAALWSALALLTSYEFFAFAQVMTPDMPVVFFTTVAAYAFWLAVSGPSAPFGMAGFYAAMGLGVFVKGPVGLLPLAVAAAWLWTDQGARGLGRLWSPSGLGIFALLTAAWLAPYLATGRESYVLDVVGQDWLRRYLGAPALDDLGHTLSESLLGLLPWTPLLPLACVRAFGAWRTPSVRFAWLWLVVTVVAVGIAHNPRARYLLSAYPAAALLTASWADTHGAVRTRLGRMLAWVGVAAALAVASSVVWLPRLRSDVLPALAGATFWLAAPALLAGLALFWGLQAARPDVLVWGVGAAALVIFGVGIWPYNAWVNRSHDYGQLAAIVARASADGGVGAFFNRELYQVHFYAGRPLHPIRTVKELNTYLAGPRRPAALINARNWEAIAGVRARSLAIVDRIRLGEQEILLVRDLGA